MNCNILLLKHDPVIKRISLFENYYVCVHVKHISGGNVMFVSLIYSGFFLLIVCIAVSEIYLTIEYVYTIGAMFVLFPSPLRLCQLNVREDRRDKQE